MSIVTSGEAGGSLSSANTNNSDQEEVIVEKQELIIINHDNNNNQNNFHGSINSLSSTTTLSNGSTTQLPPAAKKKRNPPGNPDPSADVVALSPNTLMAKNRFVCEICSKGFQRDQNLQLHRRGHNLPWKLRQRNANEVIKKRVYICPETSCVHHNPARALGDLTGIKKHFSRKHGEKKWKCERCNKKYAVQSDWKAHSKTCGTREYKCECGTIFSRRDSFITHRAFCDAIAEENSKTTILGQIPSVERHPNLTTQISNRSELISSLVNNNIQAQPIITPTNDNLIINDNKCYATSSTTNHQHHHELIINGSNNNNVMVVNSLKTLDPHHQYQNGTSHYMSATALLQKAAQMGSTTAGGGGGGANGSVMAPPSYGLAHHRDQYGHINNGSNNNNVGFFGGLLLGHHQNHAGNNNNNNNNNDVVLHGNGNSSSTNGGDVMTVDFLGIGRSQKQVVNNLIHNNNNNNNNHKQLEDHHYDQVLRFNDHQSDNNLEGLSQFEQHSGLIMGKFDPYI